jgi:hypothetical protein
LALLIAAFAAISTAKDYSENFQDACAPAAI